MRQYLKTSIISALILSTCFSLTACSSVSNKKNGIPWENGGKQPIEYTWEEFEKLSGEQQEIFVESFDSAEEFEKWEKNALENN